MTDPVIADAIRLRNHLLEAAGEFRLVGGDRTFATAHAYVTEHFDDLPDGAVVDVEFILNGAAYLRPRHRLGPSRRVPGRPIDAERRYGVTRSKVTPEMVAAAVESLP